MNYLGYANSWEETPVEIVKCRMMQDVYPDHKKHLRIVEVGKCLTEHKCVLCDYKYLVDSSD